MRSVLFTFLGLRIYTYGTALAVAFLVAIIMASRDARKIGLRPETIVDIALALCVGGVLGARFLYVLLELGYYSRHPWEILQVRSGGMSFYGGALAGFGLAWWYGKRKHLDPWPIADVCVPYAALGYALVRLGCFVNGCCYGMPSHLPWALACKEGDLYTLRHPTQLYASLGSFIIFLILRGLRKHQRFPGFLFFLYMALYAAMRGIVEAFRESQILFAGVHTTQLACLIVLIYALVEIRRRERRWRRRADVEVQDGREVGRGI